jgi:hypothetical protein
VSEQDFKLQKSIEAAKHLRTHLAAMVNGGDPSEMSEHDLRVLRDTFDGETTLDVELRNSLLAEDEDRIIIDGIKAREKELGERRNRAERRIETRRGLIEQAMAIAGWQKFPMDIGTISLGKARPRVDVDDEALIPSQFFKAPEPPEPTLDKDGLKAVLTERQKALDTASAIEDEAERARRIAAIDTEHPPIPGCHLETGGVILSIRRK